MPQTPNKQLLPTPTSIGQPALPPLAEHALESAKGESLAQTKPAAAAAGNAFFGAQNMAQVQVQPGPAPGSGQVGGAQSTQASVQPPPAQVVMEGARRPLLHQ